MKKILVLSMLSLLLLGLINFKPAFSYHDEVISFYFENKVFTYNLEKNINTNGVFYDNDNLEKIRFGDKSARQTLMKKMLSIGLGDEVTVNFLYPNIDETIKKIEKNINKKEKSAELKINTETEKVFQITKEEIGRAIDKRRIYSDIIRKFLNNNELNIKINIISIIPEIIAENFKAYTYLRGDFSTDISSSSADRKHNIKNALNKLNKREIYPNETFSFNQAVGRRDEQNGYRQAKIIVNDEFVEGLGGGVCQVSTTLYNTALLSGLEILEANKHSKQISYVKKGFDAMVNYGSSDLKFRNNTNQKLTIITNYSPNKIRIRIFGETMGNVKYKLTNEIISTTAPTEEIIFDNDQTYKDKVTYEDEYFYLKKATTGMEIKSYREKYIDNQLVDTELLRFDKYKVQNAIKVCGTKKRTEDCA